MSDSSNISQTSDSQSGEMSSKIRVVDVDEEARKSEVSETPRIHVEPSSLPVLTGDSDTRQESDTHSDAYSVVANRYNRALGHVADFMRINVIIDLPTSNDTSSNNNLSSVGVMELSLIVERNATVEKLARMVEAEYAFRYMEASIRPDSNNDISFDDSLVVAMDIVAVVFQSNTVLDFDQIVGEMLSSGDEVRVISVFYGQCTGVTIGEIVRRRLGPVYQQQGNLKRSLTLPSLNKDYVANAFALLHNFSTLKNMLDFCVQRDQIESLLFWLEVEVFRGLCLHAIEEQDDASEFETSVYLSNSKYEDILLHARYIFLTFLGERATLRLNIPTELHLALEWPIPRLHPITGLPLPLDPCMFDEIQEHVYQFVAGFLCAEYLESTHFANYMKTTPPTDDDFIIPGEHWKRFPQNRDNFERAITEALTAMDRPGDSSRSPSVRSFADSLDGAASASGTGSDFYSNIGSMVAVASDSPGRRLSVHSNRSYGRGGMLSRSMNSSMNVGLSGSRFFLGCNVATSGSRIFGSRGFGSTGFVSGSGLFGSNFAVRGSGDCGSSVFSPPHNRRASLKTNVSHFSNTFSTTANSNQLTSSSNTSGTNASHLPGSVSSLAVALSDRSSTNRSGRRHSVNTAPTHHHHSSFPDRQIKKSKKQAMVRKEKKLAKFFGDRPKHEDAYTEATTSGFIPKLQVEGPSASNSFDNPEMRSPLLHDDNDNQSITYNFLTRNARPVSKAKKIQKLNEFFGQQVPQEILFEKRIRESLTNSMVPKADLTQEDKRQLMLKVKKLRAILGEALDAESTEALTDSFTRGKQSQNRRSSTLSTAATDKNASLVVLVSQAKLNKERRRKKLNKISNFLGERITPQMLKDLETLLVSSNEQIESSTNDDSSEKSMNDYEEFPGADDKEKMILRYLIETGSVHTILNSVKTTESFVKSQDAREQVNDSSLTTADSEGALNENDTVKKREAKLSKFFGELPQPGAQPNKQVASNYFKGGLAGIKTRLTNPKSKFISGTLTPMQQEDPEPVSPTVSSRRVSCPAPI